MDMKLFECYTLKAKRILHTTKPQITQRQFPLKSHKTTANNQFAKQHCLPRREDMRNKFQSNELKHMAFCNSFFVDAIPIRVYKNNEARGVAYPNAQPMGIYSTLWNADNWATRGGLEKIDWSKAPFYAYYKDFDIEACAVPGAPGHCSTLSNWWDSPSYHQLSPIQARAYRWVRLHHMVYDYCTDRPRNPVPPPECFAGI